MQDTAQMFACDAQAPGSVSNSADGFWLYRFACFTYFWVRVTCHGLNNTESVQNLATTILNVF